MLDKRTPESLIGDEFKRIISIDCGSVLSHLQKNRLITEKYLVRHFISLQELLNAGEISNVFWSPELVNPSDGLTKSSTANIPLINSLATCRLETITKHEWLK